MMGLGPTEIILIVLVLLLLFGGKKIPELMRGLGSGVKEFKKATNFDEDDAPRRDDRYLSDRDRYDDRRLDDRRLDDRTRDDQRVQDRRSPEVR
jgi:sec-independent protein translocase protein TatA